MQVKKLCDCLLERKLVSRRFLQQLFENSCRERVETFTILSSKANDRSRLRKRTEKQFGVVSQRIANETVVDMHDDSFVQRFGREQRLVQHVFPDEHEIAGFHGVRGVFDEIISRTGQQAIHLVIRVKMMAFHRIGKRSSHVLDEVGIGITAVPELNGKISYAG